MVYRHHQRYLIDFSFSFALASQGFNGDAKFSSLYTFGISVHHIRFKIYTIVYNKHVSTTDYHVPYTQVILLSLAELFRIKHVSISTHVVMIFYTYYLSLTSGRTRAFSAIVFLSHRMHPPAQAWACPSMLIHRCFLHKGHLQTSTLSVPPSPARGVYEDSTALNRQAPNDTPQAKVKGSQ